MSDIVEGFTPGFDEETAIKIFDWLAQIIGAKDWSGCDGSETFEGDVKGTIYNILQSAGVYEDWKGTIARHAEIINLRTALATARNDALREAVAAARTCRKGGPLPKAYGEILMGWALGDAEDAAKAIEALITKPTIEGE